MATETELQASSENVCTLPSATSACRITSGDMSAIPAAVLHTAGRAALIGVGMYGINAALGERTTLREVAKNAIGGAVAIEVFALLYTWNAQRK